MIVRGGRVRYLLTLVGATSLSVLAMLAVAQAILYLRDSEAAESLARAAVARSEAISLARRDAARQASRIPHATCSPADLAALKDIAFRSSYMSDVGRITGNTIICSALWGTTRPVTLPLPRYSSGSIRLWSAADIASSPYHDSNLIAEGSMISVSSPSSFDSLDPTRQSYITIETPDRSFRFRSLLPLRPEALASAAQVQAMGCSRSAAVCAFVTARRQMIWQLPLALLATIIATGLSVGALLAYLLIRHHFSARQTIQQRLASALKGNEIGVVYQPLRHIATGALVGFEALSRWRPPGEEEIPPAIFVPIAQRVGLSPSLFRHVLALAAHDLAPALRVHRDLYVSVNAEPVDMAQECIVRYICSVAEQLDIRPWQIRIEITEREEQVSAAAQCNMLALHERGFHFLVDDFGTGSANFSRLAQSPFRGIKIDRMFVSAITQDSPLRPVLPGMYRIARELGLEVIAEGVETADEHAALACIAPLATGQGWHYGRPLQVDGALAEIARHRQEVPADAAV